MQAKKNEYLLYIDVLRFISTVLVILVHTTGPIIDRIDWLGTKTWFISNMYFAFAKCGVPIFFMISGVLFFELYDDIKIKEYYIKKFIKIVLPFIVLEFIYEIFIYKNLDAKMILFNIMSGKVYFHFWFMLYMIPIIIVSPLLLKLFKKNDTKAIELYLLFWIIFQFLLPAINNLLNINFVVKNPFTMEYTGYYLLGYYLHKRNFNKNEKKYIYVGAIVSIIIILTGTYFKNENVSIFNESYYNLFTFQILILSSTIFIFFKQSIKDNRFKVIKKINICSYGIYLIHPMVMIMINDRLHINSYSIQPIIGIAIYTLITFVGSWLVVYLYKIIKNKTRKILVRSV
ncbi:Surface polysaccharide O-acyltransferase, integral membrane enzyme [Clostridium cavendishii DSM 21758]|uniref:Surface polysaccharide O-acyltransferase, integral membrane enzyme n=1 Tax=Clostridium cavendishii DSM 21758 TaxID=1121302 RepID=A0A1M6Q973_9CLOT|nr:acyltransferase family protein [Clostridium cavendishii]SHK16802.1 Surface polysaccharide O-acyltransferase, integral membrane enzyme [Clostridium cavendishii DSM 21758]